VRPGAIVTLGPAGRTRYTVVRLGCATGMAACPNGAEAVTVVPDGKGIGWSTCHHAGTLYELEGGAP
jgi:hypothetical protein